MSKTIVIQGTTINFPEPGASPDWGQAIEDFAVATQSAIASAVGTYDVAPQVMNIDAYNPTSGNTNITNLSFSTTQVRGAIVDISVYRNTSSTTVSETTTLTLVYNASNTTGQKWEMARETVGDASITFNVTDVGQVQFTTTTLAGTGHTGILTYRARAVLNS